MPDPNSLSASPHSSASRSDAHAHPAPPASPPAAPNSLFGSALEPVLRQACDGRLADLSWFRTDWQRGGALTGYATYRDDDTTPRPVVVKLPVPPAERHWLIRLQHATDVVPRLFAHGETLGGYDMAWVVMERLPHGPLGPAWAGNAFDLIIDAAVRFSRAAREVPLAGAPRQRDYEAIREEARDNIHRHGVAHEQRWNRALKNAHHKMRDWLALWEGRKTDCWCHGDLHLGNAMTRNAPPAGPAILLDFAEVHRGHWIEDAVHLEHLYWGRRDKLEGRKICKLIARQRKACGLPVDEDWVKLAAIQRALIAMCTPAILRHAGDPLHVEASLEILEAEVG